MSASTLNLTPPFTRESAIRKVRTAEDGWDSRNPKQISLVYSPDSVWRNRAEFIQGREEIVRFLMRKWQRELDYRLIKQLWAFDTDRIAVRFAYEFHDDSGQWYRSYGDENWGFNAEGIVHHRYSSISSPIDGPTGPVLETDSPGPGAICGQREAAEPLKTICGPRTSVAR
jgi:nuclear transport factor 2 (NTF2) superfamily protein